MRQQRRLPFEGQQRELLRQELLRRELLEVIRKYVSVDLDAVKVDLVRDGEHEVLDISVSLAGRQDEGPAQA